MPRRPAPPQQLVPPDRDTLLYGDLDPSHADNLRTLRSNWKWAAFSQFFYTFAALVALPDVTLVDIEDDLARPSSLYLPRLMQRLLITLTQDRKINLDNWQTALRRQYLRRLPEANPIGPEPQVVYSDVENDDEEPEETHDDPQQPSSDPPEQPPDTPADPPLDEVPTTNGHLEPETPAAGTPSRESSKSKRKSKKKGKAGSRAQSRGAANGEPQFQFQGETKDWLNLPLLEKLDSLHLLMEWQFQNPTRLRQIMRDDDDTAQWRVEPIGYDAKTNAYWLIGPDRLWLQRALPKPPRPAKRKRPPPKATPSSSKARKLATPEDTEDDEPPARSAKRTRTQRSTRTSAANTDTPPKTSRARAAKVQANRKLDAQAKELAAFQRQAAASARTRSTRQEPASPQKQRPVFGTRASARLRGASRDDDEWQDVPEEWLKSKDGEEEDGAADEKTEDEDAMGEDEDEAGGDDSSELTELSDSSDAEVEEAPKPVNGSRKRAKQAEREVTPKEEDIPPVEEPEESPQIPSDFVEWELICLTLHDWEHVADRFAKATHYLEKALYKVLTQTIVPVVTAELKEIERKRKIEEAVVHRKRSSRIAVKESEKEEARAAAIRQAEEAEKEARSRRAEARAKKEQAEREKREKAREQRRLEREEREERTKRKEERAKNLESDRLQSGSATPSNASTSAAHERHRSSNSVHLSRVASRSSTSTPDWILDCEICHKSGVNLDDGLPMVSCGSCSRWQHITCHDHADLAAGRPRRNWESGQFYCQRCRQIIQSRRLAQSNSQPYTIPDRQYHQSHAYASKPSPTPAAYPVMQHQVYRQPTSDLRYSQPASSRDSREPYPVGQLASPPTASLPSQYQSSNGYAQYPQDQRAMYASGSATSSHSGITNGYPATPDPYARLQPPVPVPQRSTMYEPPVMSSLHRSVYPPPHPTPSHYREAYPTPQARWSDGGEHYYTPSNSNGVASRGSAGDLGYHAQDVHGGPPATAWHRSVASAAAHGERDATVPQAVVSSSGYPPTYSYSGP
ncbi:hypothetical protein BXZ70DRAFT_376563 [Cristinia sonorae]|uniref:Zinc finger PHD-type domain-containing protein n=1 Tax=Cristinia sonorae TaxID=1940300 RepID=A0A8K0XMF0_9AGAR|nr:hypothetical protein BXZ70DRAFT_376563 [Cristinia sonorae]